MTASLTQPAFRRLGMKALLVQHDIDERTATGRAATALVEELRTRLVDVVIATSAEDARAVVDADPAIQCLLLNWELGNDPGHAPAQAVLDAMRARNATVPVFLLIVTHLFMLTGLSPNTKLAWIVAAWATSLFHIAAPFVARYGGPKFSWVFSTSGIAMTVPILFVTLYPAVVMWRAPKSA